MTVGLAQFAYMVRIFLFYLVLVFMAGFNNYILSIQEYVWDLREISRLMEWPYFLHEIWKLVAKQKVSILV